MIGAILVVRLLKSRETCISLEEVIPQARIISQEEGIVEYEGIQYILGVNGLKKRKHLIKSLNLVDLERPCTVDLRFRTQVIMRKESGSKRDKPDSANVQSRRR